jgi:hypothetical protein
MAKQGHIDQRLTDVSVQYKNGEFVAQQFCPEVPVKFGSDKYTTYDKGNMFISKDDTMSKEGEANIIQGGTSTATYSVNDYGLKSFVNDTDRRNADAPLNPEIDVTEMLMQAIMLQREIRVAALFAGLGSSLYTTPGTKWAPTTGTPVTDIDTVIASMFYPPKIMGIVQTVWDKIKRNTEVLALIGGGNPAIKMATAQMFKDYFQLDNFFIINNKKNTAKAGNTASLSQVWGNSVAMAYVNPTMNVKSATFGKIFAQRQSNGATFQVRKWEDPNRGVGGSTVIQVEHQSTEKVVCTDLGAMLHTCL